RSDPQRDSGVFTEMNCTTDPMRPGQRLKSARERSRKSPAEIASEAGISVSSYYDLENSDDLSNAISLLKLKKVAKALGIRVRSLFGNDQLAAPEIRPDDLVQRLEAYLRETGISISEFEDRVGFTISPVLDDPLEFLGWNVD